MIQSTEWVLRQIAQRGYAVVIHRLRNRVEIHATSVSGDGQINIARCDRDDYESATICANELARMVGIRIESLC